MLLTTIQSDLTSFLKSRNEIGVSALRLVLAKIQNLEIEKCPPGTDKKLNDEDVLGVILKQVKQHQEAIEMFEKAGRLELAEREKAQMAAIQKYLPEQMSEKELKPIIARLNTGDFGSTMKAVMAETRGRADGSKIAAMVKNIIDA